MNIQRAKLNDLDRIFQIFLLAKAKLESNNVFQWNDMYPTKKLIEEDISNGYLYAIYENNIPQAVINISEIQEKQYAAIPWKFNDSKILVIHRLVVHPEHQRKGHAKALMDFAESFAVNYNYTSIRLDAYSQNKLILAFYQKRDYKIRGTVRFPGREHDFYCFEKALLLTESNS